MNRRLYFLTMLLGISAATASQADAQSSVPTTNNATIGNEAAGSPSGYRGMNYYYGNGQGYYGGYGQGYYSNGPGYYNGYGRSYYGPTGQGYYGQGNSPNGQGYYGYGPGYGANGVLSNAHGTYPLNPGFYSGYGQVYNNQPYNTGYSWGNGGYSTYGSGPYGSNYGSPYQSPTHNGLGYGNYGDYGNYGSSFYGSSPMFTPSSRF